MAILVELHVVGMATCGATIDNKVGIMTTLEVLSGLRYTWV